MAEDIYAKPDLTKKVKFQTDEKKDGNTDFCDNADKVIIYDNFWAEGSPPLPTLQDDTTKDQQQSINLSVCLSVLYVKCNA